MNKEAKNGSWVRGKVLNCIYSCLDGFIWKAKVKKTPFDLWEIQIFSSEKKHN